MKQQCAVRKIVGCEPPPTSLRSATSPEARGLVVSAVSVEHALTTSAKAASSPSVRFMIPSHRLAPQPRSGLLSGSNMVFSRMRFSGVWGAFP